MQANRKIANRGGPAPTLIFWRLRLSHKAERRYECPVPQDDDHFHDECGVFGVFGVPEAANLAYLGLHSLQHRGQEAAGIVTSNGEQLFAHREMGLVQDVFTPAVMERLPGDRAIGHVRYGRRGTKHVKNTQPFAVDCAHGSIAVANNGAITNGLHLRHKLEAAGSIFSSESDTEVLIHLIARSKHKTAVDRMAEALSKIEGAYSLVFLSAEELIAVRDPRGFRPLCLGQLEEGFVIASEPPAFELIGAEYIRDIEPGEMVVIDKVGLRSLRPFGEKMPEPKMCIFEYVYFARPDARLGGIGVYQARKAMGRALGREAPADVDIVVPVPDSGIAAALGYAEEINRPFELGIIRSHYVGRTFIEPQQSIRNFGVRLKLHPIRELLAGKRVAVVDDSIVRGTTSRKIVRMLRDAGVAEIHLRISSPPTKWSCFYGIDTPDREELIASNHSKEEIARYVLADSVAFLSMEGLHEAVKAEGSFCDACFTGNYPVEVRDMNEERRQLPLVGV